MNATTLKKLFALFGLIVLVFGGFIANAAAQPQPVIEMIVADEAPAPIQGPSLNGAEPIDENYKPDWTPAGAKVTSAVAEGDYITAIGTLSRPNEAMSIGGIPFWKKTDAIPGLVGQRVDWTDVSFQNTPINGGQADFIVRFKIDRDDSGKPFCKQYDIASMTEDELKADEQLIYSRFDADELFFHWREIFIAALHFPVGTCTYEVPQEKPTPSATASPTASPSPSATTVINEPDVCISLTPGGEIRQWVNEAQTFIATSRKGVTSGWNWTVAGQTSSEDSNVLTLVPDQDGVYPIMAQLDSETSINTACSATLVVSNKLFLVLLNTGNNPTPEKTPEITPTPAPVCVRLTADGAIIRESDGDPRGRYVDARLNAELTLRATTTGGTATWTTSQGDLKVTEDGQSAVFTVPSGDSHVKVTVNGQAQVFECSLTITGQDRPSNGPEPSPTLPAQPTTPPAPTAPVAPSPTSGVPVVPTAPVTATPDSTP